MRQNILLTQWTNVAQLELSLNTLGCGGPWRTRTATNNTCSKHAFDCAACRPNQDVLDSQGRSNRHIAAGSSSLQSWSVGALVE